MTSPAIAATVPAMVSRRGTLAVAKPQPADHQHRAEVLQQQGNADRHPGNGVEVEQLAARDRDQAEGGRPARAPAQQRPPAAQLQHCGDGQHERRHGDPGDHGRAGLHPASISEEANVPDVPKVAADSTASVRPAPAHGLSGTGHRTLL